MKGKEKKVVKLKKAEMESLFKIKMTSSGMENYIYHVYLN